MRNGKGLARVSYCHIMGSLIQVSGIFSHVTYMTNSWPRNKYFKLRDKVNPRPNGSKLATSKAKLKIRLKQKKESLQSPKLWTQLALF